MAGKAADSSILDLYEAHALEARREADIRTGRLNWTMAAQALLFGAFAQIVVQQMGADDNQSTPLWAVARAVAVAGVATAVAAWFGVWCANRAEQEAFRTYRKTFIRAVMASKLAVSMPS